MISGGQTPENEGATGTSPAAPRSLDDQALVIITVIINTPWT